MAANKKHLILVLALLLVPIASASYDDLDVLSDDILSDPLSDKKDVKDVEEPTTDLEGWTFNTYDYVVGGGVHPGEVITVSIGEGEPDAISTYGDMILESILMGDGLWIFLVISLGFAVAIFFFSLSRR